MSVDHGFWFCRLFLCAEGPVLRFWGWYRLRSAELNTSLTGSADVCRNHWKARLKPSAWIWDAVFFTLMFFGIALVIFAVNLAANLPGSTSGHALPTISAGLALVRYQWDCVVPGCGVTISFAAVAGVAAVLYLYLLEVVSHLSQWIQFEPLKSQEAVLAFLANALVFAFTLWFRRWASAH